MKVSLVVPCYNEEENIVPFFDAAAAALKTLIPTVREFEIVFVNDGSKDRTMEEIRRLHEAYPRIVAGVDFSRNFGKEAALFAGLQRSTGDFVTVIDADLQQDPAVAVTMIRFLLDHPEYDTVAAYQDKRIEGKTMSRVKGLFYKLINKACDVEFYAGASDFRTFRRTVVDAILSVKEYFRFSKGIFSWVGFNTYYMPYEVKERNAGTTKWTVRKLIRYAIDGFVSFTTAPLKVSTYIGMGCSVAAILYMLVVIVQKLFFSIEVEGYPTIVVLVLLIGGIQLMMLGILGEYLARTYMQGKHRPIYIERAFLKIDEE